jgi:hypothetical protein
MEKGLTFKYDRLADILYIDKTPPYPEQETEELGDDVIARLNPTTGEIENRKCCSSPPACCARICLNYQSKWTFV